MSTGFAWFLHLQTPFLSFLSFLSFIPIPPHYLFSPSTEAMNKVEKPQILVLSLLAILLIIALYISSSVRPPYLSSSPTSSLLPSEHKPAFSLPFPTLQIMTKTNLWLWLQNCLPDKRVVVDSDEDKGVGFESSQKFSEKKAKVVEKSRSEKIAGTVKIDSVKKCPSMPSLFFIGVVRLIKEIMR
ncbi:uncharacterized protein Pyn_05915 [Prunus yedoensis var. nudiflora]|uniref:Uncharacterized protein n=1 Tax=Prunus yedoensis var. nudiflora TaxID=2094558 RepID=A0A314XM18_PRUYE|nr:uncharacterized protein Pyn_05915 [Prunus yedoensis var. nudiflora]